MEPSFLGGDDFFGIGGPTEWLRLFAVVLINEAADGGFALGDGVEDHMLQTPPCQLREEPLHRIHPGGRGGGEMKRPPGMLVQPRVNLLGTVRRGVVENDMHIEIFGDLPGNGACEVDELLAPVAVLALSYTQAIKNVQGGKHGGGSVTFSVVGAGLGMALFSSAMGPGYAPVPGSATSHPPITPPLDTSGFT